jgi:hypothetical protein
MKNYRLEPVEELEGGTTPELSVFLPVYNEQENIEQLNTRLTEALEGLGPQLRGHLC